MSDQASWMNGFQSNKLCELVLPLSHNSGTSRYSAMHQAGFFQMFLIPFAKRWDRCQTLGIKQQLEIGVRGVDLRVATVGKHTFTVHSLVCVKLVEVFKEIQEFLDENPTEVVVILICEGWKSLTGMKWKVSWSDVKKCIEKSGLKFITNASGYPLRDLAGRAIFTMKQGMGESLGLEFLSDLVLIDSWGKTNSSTPRALVEKVKTWYHNVPAKAPPGNLHLLQTQCTPTDVQVKSFYLPYLRWKASSPSEELKYTSLSSLHKEVWPIIQDRIFSDQVKPVVVGLDFVDVDNVACIVAHNNITINVSSSQLLHTSTAEESQYWDCIEE